jgi:hypothetical protein
MLLCVQNARGATLIQFNTHTLCFALINAIFLDWTERAAPTACKFCIELIGTEAVSMNLFFATVQAMYYIERNKSVKSKKYKQ